jgi:hypothetical protein
VPAPARLAASETTMARMDLRVWDAGVGVASHVGDNDGEDGP